MTDKPIFSVRPGQLFTFTPAKMMITFTGSQGVELGKLYETDGGGLEFEGNVSESAQMFFDVAMARMSGRIAELLAQVERLEAAPMARTDKAFTLDTETLKALAAKVKDYSVPEPWGEDRRYGDDEVATLEFAAAASPAVVLELIDGLEHLREVMKWRDRALMLMNHAYGIDKTDDAVSARAKAQAVRSKADLYDEVWALARSLGYANVTDGLAKAGEAGDLYKPGGDV